MMDQDERVRVSIIESIGKLADSDVASISDRMQTELMHRHLDKKVTSEWKEWGGEIGDSICNVLIFISFYLKVFGEKSSHVDLVGDIFFAYEKVSSFCFIYIVH